MNKVHGNFRHGMKETRLYHIWCNMKARCANPNHTFFSRYGARGITVCAEWSDFLDFRKWALSNGYSDNLTLDRVNPHEGYSPSNCRWVDMKTQENNRTNNHLVTYHGITKTVSEWADEIGLPYKTLYSRLFQYHWDYERALGGANR